MSRSLTLGVLDAPAPGAPGPGRACLEYPMRSCDVRCPGTVSGTRFERPPRAEQDEQGWMVASGGA